MPRSPKMTGLIDEVRKAAEAGDYRFTRHAEERMVERQVNLAEVDYILRNAYHRPSKDEWNEQWKQWRYSICGRTVDQRNIRLAVTFSGVMWIVTVIDEDN